jgi:hypothetical protein
MVRGISPGIERVMELPSEMSPVAEAQLALMDVARKQYADEYADRPEIVELARYLCKADGHDPDSVVFGLPDQPLLIGARGLAAFNQGSIRPSWVWYVHDALSAVDDFNHNRDAFISVADAMGRKEKAS